MKLKKNVDPYCDVCMSEKVKECLGGDNITLRKGFYRKKGSPIILKCKNLLACDNSQCTEYYDPNSFLCSLCHPSLNLGRTSSWECISILQPPIPV